MWPKHLNWFPSRLSSDDQAALKTGSSASSQFVELLDIFNVSDWHSCRLLPLHHGLQGSRGPMSVVLLRRRPPGCCRLDPLLHRSLRTLDFLGLPGFLGVGPDLLQPDLLDPMVPGKPGDVNGGAAPQMSDVALEQVGAAATGANISV